MQGASDFLIAPTKQFGISWGDDSFELAWFLKACLQSGQPNLLLSRCFMTTLTLANDPGLGLAVQRATQWLKQHGGLAGWCIVSVCRDRVIGNLLNSVRPAGASDEASECDESEDFDPEDETWTGAVAFCDMPWDGDGLYFFANQDEAEAEAKRIRALNASERRRLGLPGTVVVAFFSRMDWYSG